MHAVNDYAEASGALLLAEGIATEQHLTMARALGARLGQSWLFGRPGPGAAVGLPVGELLLPASQSSLSVEESPFAPLHPGHRTALPRPRPPDRLRLRPGRGPAGRAGAGRAGRGAVADDPLRGEWDVAVVSPHFAAALLARDLGDTGPDLQRMFKYSLTYDRDTVVRATNALLSRVVPRLPLPSAGAAPTPPNGTFSAPRPGRGLVPGGGSGEALLHRALAATISGVTIAALDRPDQPLIYVNAAFEQLSGYRAEEVLGGNCRFLQGPDTNAAAVNRLRAAIAAGQECRETLLNHRGPERTPWWNEIFLAPVHDADGRVVQYIGVQNDVTARVEAERALERERLRAQSYLARIEQFAFTDPLTGLANRRRVEERLEVELWDARADDGALALLFLDLDGKAVNERLGHGAGDELLIAVGRRLRERLRRGDLLARLGGDEFLVVLTGLAPGSAAHEAGVIAEQLADTIARPVPVAGGHVSVRSSIGVAVFPQDGDSFAALLQHADQGVYAAKRAHGRGHR